MTKRKKSNMYVPGETDAPLMVEWEFDIEPNNTGKDIQWGTSSPGLGIMVWSGLDTIDWWEDISRTESFRLQHGILLNPYRQTATHLPQVLSKEEKEFMTMPPFRVERNETGKLWVAYLKRSRSGINYISKSRYLAVALSGLWQNFHGLKS